MDKIFRKRLVFISLLLLLIILLCWPLNVLTLRETSQGKICYIRRVNGGEKFVFSYIHSVSKTPIREVLKVGQNNEIKLLEVHYIDQGGAGMPEYAWGNEVFEKQGDWFVIKNFSRTFREIIFTIQEKYKNKLIFNKGQEIDLTKLTRTNNKLILKLKTIPFFQYKYYQLLTR